MTLLVRRLLLAGVFLLACEKSSKKNVPPPPDLIGVVAVGSLDGAVGRLKSYLEAVQPGAGAQLNAAGVASILSMGSGLPIGGFALDKPLHIVILDPKKHPRPFLLLGTADAAKLRGGDHEVRAEGGRALVGAKEAVDATAAWAFSALDDAPGAPTLKLDVARLAELYRPDIERFRKDMGPMFNQSPVMAKVLGMEIDLVLKLAEQTTELTVVVDASAEEASVEFGLRPRAGSTFEKFVKVQRPAKIDLLARIPGTEKATHLIVVDYELGPVRDVMYDLMGGLFGELLGAPPDAAFKKKWDALLSHFQGPTAGAMWIDADGGLAMQQLAAVDDGARTVADAQALVPLPAPRTIEVLGVKMTLALNKAVATHEGATIDEYTFRFDADSFPEEQRELLRRMYGDEMHLAFAGQGSVVAITWGKTAVDDIRRLLDAARGTAGAALRPAVKAALDTALRRKSSFAFFMNLAAPLAAATGRAVQGDSGMLTDVTFADGTTRLRVGVPAAHIRELTASMQE